MRDLGVPEWELYGNALSQWLIAVAVAVVTIGAVWGIKRSVGRQLERSGAESKSRFLTVVGRSLAHTKWFFYLLLALFLGSQALDLPEGAEQGLRIATVVAVLLQLGVWAQHALRYAVERYQARHADERSAATMAEALGFIGRLVVWTVVLLLVLSNIGVEITALLAGLGIGGLALALAMQNLATDFVASLTIYFDRPFDIGDFIITGDILGTVTRVGWRSTQLAALSGEQLVVSNSDILKSRIRNFKRMQERRIVFEIGVTYQTPMAQVEAIPQTIRTIIEGEEMARFDRSHFKAYGDYALVFETVYYVLAPDFGTYMDVQQRINLALGKRFESEGIEFAYPTTTVLLEQIVEKRAS
jgi:small-conductance mechanosensitive channel